MSDVKQVKVANWGIYFLQRLKHFFNRTDYCDLTLQFQDNAQLKVHRLVLSACTEYFELLERTCEMYEDCLVMPDDLQADVVVPIVNFMYTGQLEFKMELLERLYQTSQILNLPVLTKLLESHRSEVPKATPTHSYSAVKKFSKSLESAKLQKSVTPTSTSNKRSYSKAFDKNLVAKEKKVYHPINKSDILNNSHSYAASSPISDISLSSKKVMPSGDPRPTRYELPEELDKDNIFENSFCNISYTSTPLMIHPDTVKRYSSKKNRSFGEASGSRTFSSGVSTVDIVECKRITKGNESIFDDSLLDHSMNNDHEMFSASYISKDEVLKDSSQLFDQILDQSEGPKVTIETKDSKLASNIDHAKIISEVLKKYPHLVKTNKNIKLKILNTQTNTKTKKQQQKASYLENKPMKLKSESEPDFTYETDVLDSKEAAKLIALGAENVRGPWICLICGAPGKALHFSSYYKFRRHLVEIHKEKPVSNICEYCGLKSLKRNYLLHHLFSQHGVPPPPQYNFPRCNKCNYIALTEGFLVKHKMSHEVRNFRCNVCATSFTSSNQLLTHIQNTGHKYSGDRKTNLQCIYCLKVFLRETNLYAHLKTHHKKEAKSDGIIEDSDEEKMPENDKPERYHNIKLEPSRNYGTDSYEVDLQFEFEQKPAGDQIVSRKQHIVNNNPKQKILNSGFGTSKPAPKPKAVKNHPERNKFLEDISEPNNYEDIVMIDNNEYIVRDHQLIPRKEKNNDEFIISDYQQSLTDTIETMQPTTSMEFTNQTTNIEGNVQPSSMIIKNPSNLGQPIQIVVSNEEEYKALMSSNHPIIFDNSESNKTLTVLTAPHESTLETTTIDLDKSETNNMMIIPEDYPLSVSETVSPENPNIVVVYSHPVDDQNKQYQIITTQGLGAQFIQSSAMLTHNYETVTTSTPVMSAHVLDSQVEETWQNNVHTMENQHEQIAPEAELHTIIQSDHVEITPIQNQVNDNQHEENIITADLPKEIPFEEVNEPEHLPSIEVVNQGLEQVMPPDDHTLTDQPDAITSESHDPSQSCEQLQVHEATDLQDSSTAQVVIEDLGENEIDKESSTFVSTESNFVSEVDHQVDTEHIDIIQESIETEPAITETLTEETLQQEDIAETAIETPSANATEDNTLKTESIQDTDIPEEQEVAAAESQVYTEMSEINPTPNEEITQAEEKIQNLTSEWSEDEYDTVPEEPDQPAEIISKQVEENQPQEETSESEETIENIRHEVEKQMSTGPVAVDEKTTENDIPQGENLPNSTEPQQVGVVDTTESPQDDPKQKISSLLTDWEDNDSQEENDTSMNESQEETPLVNDNEDVAKSVEDSPEVEHELAEPQDTKVDNIKKLVSDWDDEDEEIK